MMYAQKETLKREGLFFVCVHRVYLRRGAGAAMLARKSKRCEAGAAA